MGMFDQYMGATTPYSLGSRDQYDGVGSTWGMPGASMYTGVANNFQQPRQSFSDFLKPDAPGMFGGRFDGLGENLKASGFLGSTDTKTGIKTDGWGGAALGAAQGLMSGYMGMKNYGLAKQSLAQGKDQFERNYAAQKTTTNGALEDRQRARVASGSGYQSVDEYMNKNRIA